MKLGKLEEALVVLNNHKGDTMAFKNSIRIARFIDNTKVEDGKWKEEIGKIWNDLGAKDDDGHLVQPLAIPNENVEAFNERVNELADTDVDIAPYFEEDDFTALTLTPTEAFGLIPVIKES